MGGKALSIIDQKKSLSFYCPTCKKWLTVVPGAVFLDYEANWYGLMALKYNVPCKCGQTATRKVRIGQHGEFKTTEDYFKRCYNYIKGHFKKDIVKHMLEKNRIFNPERSIYFDLVNEKIKVCKNPLKDFKPLDSTLTDVLEFLNISPLTETLTEEQDKEIKTLVAVSIEEQEKEYLKRYDRFESFNGLYHILK